MKLVSRWRVILALTLAGLGSSCGTPGDSDLVGSANCGNGLLEKSESCDDSNTFAGDGCGGDSHPRAALGHGIGERSPLGEEHEDPGGTPAGGDGGLEMGISRQGGALGSVWVGALHHHDLPIQLQMGVAVVLTPGLAHTGAPVDQRGSEASGGGDTPEDLQAALEGLILDSALDDIGPLEGTWGRGLGDPLRSGSINILCVPFLAS